MIPDLLEKRFSVRQFQEKTVSPEVLALGYLKRQHAQTAKRPRDEMVFYDTFEVQDDSTSY